MAVEIATFINTLDSALPSATDAKSEGDDHLRLLKATIKATFPNVTAALTPTHTQLNFVTGVTSAIQTQIDTKAPIASPAFTTAATLPAATTIGTVTAAEILRLSGVSSAIQTQFDSLQTLKAPLASPTFTGTVILPATGAGATEAVRKDYADGLSFATVLPGQSGNAGKLVTTNGTTASWTDIKTVGGLTVVGAGNIPILATLVRSARTTNTVLGLADASTLIDITSGTFTQTFTAAATLASGWICYIRNSGTGNITLDPNAAELIDGLTSYVMYPGEVRLVQCDGTALRTLVLQGGTFTSSVSGNWTKPPGYQFFDIRLSAGGSSGSGGGGGGSGSGVATNGGATGGGGGAAGQNGVTARKRASAANLPSTVAYLIGAATIGGAAGAGAAGVAAGAAGLNGANAVAGVAGNASSFGASGAAVRVDAAGGTVPSASSLGQGGVQGSATTSISGGTNGNNTAVDIAFQITATDQNKSLAANGGNGAAGVARAALTAPGTAGGSGGVTSLAMHVTTAEAGGVPGAGSGAVPTAGSAGTKPVSTAMGIGGAGGGGGGGSASAGGVNAASGAGGAGGAGGDGGAGEIEITGVA